jgi:hypothetical protein
MSKPMTSSVIAWTAAEGVDLEGGGHEVAVEHHVQALIGGHPQHDLVGHRVIGIAAGVAVRDAGDQ